MAESKYPVPLASDTSVQHSSDSRSRMKSFGSSTWAVRARRCGSCVRTHTSFGAWKPSRGRLPVCSISLGTPSRSSSSRRCGPVRRSHQRIASRIGCCARSSSVSPCICPVSPIARTSSARSTREATAARASKAAASQDSGDCSAQPGRGVCRSYVDSWTASVAPEVSTRTARAPVVPRSRPIIDAVLMPAMGRGDCRAVSHSRSARAGRLAPHAERRRPTRRHGQRFSRPAIQGHRAAQ